MSKFLLSTGKETENIAEYVLDLFSLYLMILPGDIPRSDVGFDFIISGVQKPDLPYEIKSRLSNLVDKIKDHTRVKVEIDSIEIVDETKARVTVSVGRYTKEIELDVQ